MRFTHAAGPRRSLGLILLVLLVGALPPRAAALAPEETPDQACLSMETFPVPGGDHPHDVAPAADGEGVWYTAQGAGSLGLLDLATGEVERVPLGEGSAPHGVVVGPDGAAWVTDSGLNAIIRVDARTREVRTWPLETPGANLNTGTFDRDGVFWFTGQGGVVGRVDPGAERATAETIPAPRGRGPYGITATPAGEVYFVSLAGSYLGRIEVRGDGFAVTEIEPPTPEQGARRVWSDSAGVLWVSEWNAGQLGRYDPQTESWLEWPLPGDAPQAYAVYVDERDDVWLSDFGANALVRFDPDTEAFAVLPLPDSDAAVRQIHGRPGEVWGAESGADKLVRVATGC